jgi:hypothetical protein
MIVEGVQLGMGNQRATVSFHHKACYDLMSARLEFEANLWESGGRIQIVRGFI